MKGSISLLIIIFLFTISCSVNAQVCGRHPGKNDAADVKNLVGTWEGNITFNGSAYPMKVAITEKNGLLVAEITDRSLKGTHLTAGVSICSQSKYHFYGVLPDGQQFRYNPRLVNGSLTGSFQVGDVCAKDKPEFSLVRLL